MVSIIIPTFRRPDLLRRALFSVACQTVHDFEVIVVDDGSPEESDYQKVAKDFGKIFMEFSYLRNVSNLGANAARNIGIRNSHYGLLAFLDDDDEWMPAKIERQLAMFRRANSSVGLVYAWADTKDETGAVLYEYRAQIEGKAIKEILESCFIPSPTVMVRKSAIMEAGCFDEKLVSCQDWDMWTSIISLGYECLVAKEVLAINHKHGKWSIGNSKLAPKGYYQYYRKHLHKIMMHVGIKRKIAVAFYICRSLLQNLSR